MTEVPNSVNPDPPAIDPDPPLPPPVAETVRARGRQKKYVLLSVVTLFIAVLTVVAALLLRSRTADEPPAKKIDVKPAGAVTNDEPEQPAPEAKPDPTTQQKIKQHLSRAKRHIRAARWRSALFFLDQVLIHDPTHAEARALMAKVEKRAKGKPGAAPVRLASRRRARAVYKGPKTPRTPRTPRSRARAPRARAEAKPEVVLQEAEVAILSKPSATAHLDGVLLGKTPLRGVTVQPGRHTLKVFEEGYIAYTKEIEVKPTQKKTIEVKLKALPSPVQLVRTSKKAAAHQQKKSAKPPAARPRPDLAPKSKKSGRVPTIKLPTMMKVQAYKDGKKHKMLRQVCNMVESVVTKATKKSATGTTHQLRNFLYASYRGKVTPLTLYPRTMGYIIAEQLMKGKSRGAVGSLLLFNHRNGRIKALAAKNWRPL
jgi:hypothetical protein